MNAFVQATEAQQNIGATFNGAVSLVNTGSRVLNLFKSVGQRGADLTKEFDLAVSEDRALALRTLLWTRDIRGGAGEREVVRKILRHMEQHYLDETLALIPKLPEYGRWDDLLVFQTVTARAVAFNAIKTALEEKNGLCAKWMPRKGADAVQLRKFLNWTPKRYRKTLATLSKTVEQNMCAQKWNEIVYDHVPSVAAARYQKTFFKHDPERYKAYREGLTKVDPETGKMERKVNAGAVFPYDVIKSIRNGDRQVAEAQWNALPNFLGEQKILSIVDVSVSMNSWGYYGQRAPIKSSVTPLDIALSLGLYTADKLSGAFEGMFMTFSTKPKIQKLTGSIVDKLNQLRTSHWEMSTNVDAAFQAVLELGVKNKVPQADMPEVLLILSDMEFDACVRHTDTNFNLAKIRFEEAGYKLPKVVFWHINGRSDNNPVDAKEDGTALVSGFSPAIFKSILASDLEDFTPYNVMLKTLLVPRYDVSGLTV